MHYDPCQMTYDLLWAELEQCLCHLAVGINKSARVVEIPVCYDAAFAPDLAEVADYCGLTTREVIQRHCQAGTGLVRNGVIYGPPRDARKSFR